MQPPIPPLKLDLNFQSLEWQQMREYLQRRKDSLLEKLVASNDNEERSAFIGRIREINTLLAEEKRPLAAEVGAAPFA